MIKIRAAKASPVNPKKTVKENVNVVKRKRREDWKWDSKTQPSYQQSLQILSVVFVYYDRKDSMIIFLWERKRAISLMKSENFGRALIKINLNLVVQFCLTIEVMPALESLKCTRILVSEHLRNLRPQHLLL